MADKTPAQRAADAIAAELNEKIDAAEERLAELHKQRDTVLEEMRPLETRLRDVNALIESVEAETEIRELRRQYVDVTRVRAGARTLRNLG